MNTQFTLELSNLLNTHSIDAECETPDFILAEHIVNYLQIYKSTINMRDSWLGYNDESDRTTTV